MLNKIRAFFRLQDNLSPFKNKSDELNYWLNSDLSKNSNMDKFDKFLSSSYFNLQGDLTEEKYKFICLHIFLQTKDFFISNMPLTGKILEDLSDKLIATKGTYYEMKNLIEKNLSLIEVNNNYKMDYILRELNEETNLVYNRVDSSVNLENVFKEDKDNYEKIKIAKNIYKDFNNCGILADKLKKNKEHLSIVLELQNYKLEPNDYKSLEKYIEEGNIDYYIHPNTKASIWNELINNENSIENLNAIKKFIVAANESSFGLYTHEKDEPAIMNNIEAKITYIELHGEMLEDKPITSKPKKIKI